MYETKRIASVAFSRRLCLTTSVLAICVAISVQPVLGQTRTYSNDEINSSALDTTGTGWTLDVASGRARQTGIISGDGSITMTGAGVLELWGANTYSGGTTVAGTGLLNLRSSDALGTGSVTLGLGGLQFAQDLTFANDIILTQTGRGAGDIYMSPGTSQVVLSGTISGSGALTKFGLGNVVINGSNTYSGGTYIQHGTVTPGSSTAFGTGTVYMLDGTRMLLSDGIVLSNNISFDSPGPVGFNIDSGTARLIGVIGGVGRLEKTGNGRLELGGANLFTGGALLRGGTVALHNVDNLGTGVVDIANTTLEIGNGIYLENNVVLGAGVVFTSDGTGTIDGDLTGTGGFTVSGGNTIAIGGNNSFTGRVVIADGILSVVGANALNGQSVYVADGGTLEFVENGDNDFYTLASLDGAGNVSFDGRRLTIGTNNADMEFSGTFFEFGELTKLGTGTLTVTSSYLDLTNRNPLDLSRFFVREGKLVNRGTIANGVVIGEGTSILTGDGLYPRLIASQTSTIAPGEAANSIGVVRADWVEVREDAFYEVNVTADGQSDFIHSRFASLSGTVVVRGAAGDYGQSIQYHILEATDGIDIEGGDITRFRDVTSDLFFYDASLTYDPNNVWLTLARNGRTFDQVSGITANQKAVAPVLEGFGAGNVLFDNIVSGTEAEAHAGLDSLSGEFHAGVGTALIGESRLVQEALLGRMRQPFSSLLDGSFAALGYAGDDKPAAADGWIVTPWTQAFGGFQQFNSNGNAATLRQGTGGMLFGVDGTLDNRFRLGVAGGVSGSRLSGETGPSSADISSYHIAAYGVAELDALALRFGAAYSWNTLNTSRDIAFRSFADQTAARYGAQTGQVFGEVGYKLALGQVLVEPFAGVSVVGVSADSFRESGGAAALNGAGFSQSAAFTTLGLRGNWTVNASEAGILSLNAGLGWRHAFNANPAVRDLAFNSGGAVFQVAGVPAASDSLALEAGLDFETTARLNFGLNYSGQVAGAFQSHSLKAGLGFTF